MTSSCPEFYYHVQYIRTPQTLFRSPVAPRRVVSWLQHCCPLCSQSCWWICFMTSTRVSTSSSVWITDWTDCVVYRLGQGSLNSWSLFIDSCALVTHSARDVQYTTAAAARAAQRFELIISRTETRAIYHPAATKAYTYPAIQISGTVLKAVNRFCHLSIVLSDNGPLDDELTRRTIKASFAFSKLTRRMWEEHGIKLDTKLMVYLAVPDNSFV